MEPDVDTTLENNLQTQKSESTFQSMGLQPIVPSLYSGKWGVALGVLTLLVLISVFYRILMAKKIMKRQRQTQDVLSKEISKHKSSSLSQGPS